MEATSRQLWALYCATKKDYRNEKLTKEQASKMLSEFNANKAASNNKGNKEAVFSELCNLAKERQGVQFACGFVRIEFSKNAKKCNADFQTFKQQLTAFCVKKLGQKIAPTLAQDYVLNEAIAEAYLKYSGVDGFVHSWVD